jgi:hypothetical protein
MLQVELAVEIALDLGAGLDSSSTAAMCLRSANTSFFGAHVAVVASPMYSLKELSSA